MMGWIVRTSLAFRLLVIPVAALITIVGIVQLRDAPVDALPEFSPPHVEVQTEALGLSAAEVEQLITVPMEQDLLNGVAWLDEIRSESIPGLSRIEMVFEPGTDVMRARQLVAERLAQAHALPNVSKPPIMLQPLSSTSRVMMIGLSSKQLSLVEMSVLARWRIKPRLMGVPGVANVAIWGQRERQLQVQVDPERLQRNGVTLNQVVETTGNALWFSPLSFVEASTPGTGGFVDTANQRLGIQHILPIRTPQDLAQVTIEDTEGKTLRLGDVAQVEEDHQPLIGDALGKDGPSLMLVIEKFPGTSTTEVARGVEDALDALRPGLTGIETDTSLFRPAGFIDTAVDNLGVVALIGLVLLAVLLAAVFLDWRAALISLVALPLSLVATALVLYLRGTTFNTVILAGLVVALGAVVDDAIVDVDNIKRRLRQRRRRDGDASTASVVVDATLEVRRPLLYATLIILAVAVPAFVLGGVTGAFSRELALSYSIAVVVSFVVALTVTPPLALLLYAKTAPGRRRSRAVDQLRRAHGTVLSRVTRRAPWAYGVYGAVAVIAIAALAMLPQLDEKPLLPALKDRNVLIHWEGAAGTSYPEMSRVTAQASRELRSLPGVSNVGAHVGRAITSDEVVNVNSGELWVTIDADADYDATLAAVQEVVDGYPGLRQEIQTYPEERVRAVRRGTDADLVVRVYGQDRAVLRDKAAEVRRLLADVDGVAAPHVDVPGEEPTVEIEMDLAAAERYGIKPGDVRRAAATMLSGLEVGNLFEDQKVFEVVVWGTPSTRHSLTSIEQLIVDTPGGGHVRLGQVADVRITPNVGVIRHDAVSPYVDVAADVRGRGLDAVVADARELVRGVEFPLEHHAEVLGVHLDRKATQDKLLLYGVAVTILVFLLLQAAFQSWRLAALALLLLPLSLAGGVVAAYLGGSHISLAALVGLVTVFTVAVRQSVVLIDHLRRLRPATPGSSDQATVLQAVTERAVPMLATTGALVLLLLPIVVFGGEAGLEVLHPMAVVVLGGLVTATLVNLVVLPALYLLLAPRAGGATPVAPLIGPRQPENASSAVPQHD